MKKIIGIIIVVFNFTVFSSNCFAADVSQDEVIKKIGKQMIKEKQISKDCIKYAKGNINKMIKINQLLLITTNESTTEEDQMVIIESSGEDACYMGNSRTPLWVYNKKSTSKNYRKIFGPEYPDDINFTKENMYTGVPGLEAAYGPGNFDKGFVEIYRFDGKNYKMIGKRNN